MALDIRSIDREENRRRMRSGELYYAFTPDLIADRRRCRKAYEKLNTAEDLSRRALIELWKEFVISSLPHHRQTKQCNNPTECSLNGDLTPLPAPAATAEADEELLEDYPWIDGPIKMDYGYNVE